jgi:hypothetical protein
VTLIFTGGDKPVGAQKRERKENVFLCVFLCFPRNIVCFFVLPRVKAPVIVFACGTGSNVKIMRGLWQAGNDTYCHSASNLELGSVSPGFFDCDDPFSWLAKSGLDVHSTGA